MASNIALHPTRERRWFSGFGNMFYKQNHQWWGTWSWLVQIVIWLIIINGMFALVVLLAPNSPEAKQALQAASEAEIAAMKAQFADQGLTIYFAFGGLITGAGVAVRAQDALIGEKRSGTAAWVLSKPVSRAAFLLAKLAADAIGILVTMCIIQGVIGYFIYKASTGISLPIPNCLAAMGLVAMVMLFFLCLTYMLGAVSDSRGLTVGVPLLLVGGQQIGNMVPLLVKTMPWQLVTGMRGNPALAISLLKGQRLATVTPIICTAVMTVLFIVVAVWRFQREEF
jgi:ABC-2 type transport system permease protein